METLRTESVSPDLLHKLQDLCSRGYAYCTRRCGRWGSPDCFSCMFRDVRQVHEQLRREHEESLESAAR